MAGPFSFGSDNWPGLGKVAEECGELSQVIGKLIATGGEPEHWDGTNLIERLQEEIADLTAAMEFLVWNNELNPHAIYARANAKLDLFKSWHAQHAGSDAAADPAKSSEDDDPIGCDTRCEECEGTGAIWEVDGAWPCPKCKAP